MDRFISRTRCMVVVAVIASLVLAATLFLFGAVQAAGIIAGTIGALGDAKRTKAFAIGSVEIADFFLIATALYIVGVGLYELFIRDLDLSAWMLVFSSAEITKSLGPKGGTEPLEHRTPRRGVGRLVSETLPLRPLRRFRPPAIRRALRAPAL